MNRFRPSPETPRKNVTQDMLNTERKAAAKSGLAALAAVVLIILAVIAFLLWPGSGPVDKQQQDQPADTKDSQSAFKGLVSEDWPAQLDDLKEQIAHGRQAVGETVETVQAESQKFLQENGLEERAVQLQSYVSEIAGENGVYGLLSRFEGLDSTVAGQQALDASVRELAALLTGAESKDTGDINAMLDSARAQSPALQSTLGNVPQNDLKAAAMLMAMTQVRSALNRGDEAFDKDLGLLMNMVGDDNTALKNALEKLAPHSKSGVLSFQGLQSEFRTIAGEVVAESLSGEDVSFSEKASARMNDLFQVERDGALVTGTQTQGTVHEAARMMENGHLEGAVTFLKTRLNAKELAPLRPWIRKAETVLTSQKVQKQIRQAIDLTAGNGFLGGAQLLDSEE